MKQLFAALVVGLIIGAFIAIKYFPTTIEKPIEVIKTDVKTKVITKEIVRPNGQIERETVAVTDSKTETQSKVPPKYHVTLQKSLAIHGRNDAYSISINKRVYENFYLSAGINTEKQVSVGIGMEF